MQKPTHYLVFASCIALAALGCNGNDTDSGALTISGVASKGPIAGATVTVYASDTRGERLDVAGASVTRDDGSFEVELATGGLVEVVVTGGTYVDEASGQPVALRAGDELRAFIADAQDGDAGAVTALTTIAAARAAAAAEEGLARALAAVNRETSALFGLGNIDVGAVMPADLSRAGGAPEAMVYGAVLAGLSQLAADRGLDPAAVLDLVAAMAEDFEDGVINGLNGAGEALAHASEITPEEAMIGLETAIAAYLAGPNNASGMTPEEFLADVCQRTPQLPGC